MVRSGRSAGLTPAPCAAGNPGLASEETAAADAPRNPRRELVFDIVAKASWKYYSRTTQLWQTLGQTANFRQTAPEIRCQSRVRSLGKPWDRAKNQVGEGGSACPPRARAKRWR